MEKKKFLATVNFLVEDDMVWLAKKTRKIGVGLLNGYGGKFKPVEDKDLIACSVREVRQECKVDISQAVFKKVAIINFHNIDENKNRSLWEVHYYIVKNFTGTPKENRKDGGMVEPNMYNKNNLPLGRMMLADRKFFPSLMQDKKIIGEYFYGRNQETFTKKGWYKIVDSLPD